MALHLEYVTDPSCPWSWGAEPLRRRVEREFGAGVRITCVMGGRAREFGRPEAQVAEWLDAADATRMPVDPRLWWEGPPRSSFPACLAVIAAREQGHDAALLRRLRVGLLTGRRKLDTTEALVEEARGIPGLDASRFRVDLASSATVEGLGADLERAGEHRADMPVFLAGGTAIGLRGGWDAVRDALRATGAEPAAAGPAAGVEEALRREGPLAVAEVAALCDLPAPRAAAELWRLALEWRAQPERRLTGELWSAG